MVETAWERRQRQASPTLLRHSTTGLALLLLAVAALLVHVLFGLVLEELHVHQDLRVDASATGQNRCRTSDDDAKQDQSAHVHLVVGCCDRIDSWVVATLRMQARTSASQLAFAESTQARCSGNAPLAYIRVSMRTSKVWP